MLTQSGAALAALSMVHGLYGVGFVLAPRRLFSPYYFGTPAGPLLVLVRNVTSRQFRPALLSVRG